jgi:glycosyltransferase involved in cell wall biosynthesis
VAQGHNRKEAKLQYNRKAVSKRHKLMSRHPHISVVSPVYQAEQIVSELVRQIIKNVETITEDFEIILVEDGSRDRSWEAVELACTMDERVQGIKLSRNFGQHYAITAGLVAATGEWIVVMDCDLQDRPDQIEALYRTALQGYDTVCAQRTIRNDGFAKRMYSKAFYKLFSYLTETEQDSSIGNFGIYSHKVIRAVLSMNDATRYFPAMVQWVGFRKTKIQVQHSSRFAGETTYSFRKLMVLALNTVICFSDKPLRLVVLSGITISGISFMIGIGYLFGKILGLTTVAGYTSIIVSIWMTAGIIIVVLGIVGLYVGKSFEKTKMRPVFLVDEIINTKRPDVFISDNHRQTAPPSH